MQFVSESGLEIRWPQAGARVLNPLLGNVCGTVRSRAGYSSPQIQGRIYREGETCDFAPPPVPESVPAVYSEDGTFRFETGIPTRGTGRSVVMIWATYHSLIPAQESLIDTCSAEIVVY